MQSFIHPHTFGIRIVYLLYYKSVPDHLMSYSSSDVDSNTDQGKHVFSIQWVCKYISNPKQPSCEKKCAALRKAMVKKDEIQGGGQEMAVMVG